MRCILDSKRHILVTDLDSAIAEISSNSLQGTEDDMAKNDKETPLKLSITLPIKRAVLLPEINVLPATPISTDLDESRMFTVKPRLPDEEDRPKNSGEKNVASKDEDGDRCSETTPESKANGDLSEEFVDVKEDSQIQDGSSIVLEANEESKEANGECSFEEKDPDGGAKDIGIKSKETGMKGECEEKPSEDSLNEIPDTSSESSKESWSLRKEQKRERPKSASEMALDNHGDMESTYDSAMQAFLNTASRQNIERINTFHLGSKSMVSIGKDSCLIVLCFMT